MSSNAIAQGQPHKARPTAKRTENPGFGTPLCASCLALESAEREHTKPRDLNCFLWADLREGRVLGMCWWHVLRTVETASENVLGGFSPKIMFGFTIVFLLKDPPKHDIAFVLAVKSWVVVPENLSS